MPDSLPLLKTSEGQLDAARGAKGYPRTTLTIMIMTLLILAVRFIAEYVVKP